MKRFLQKKTTLFFSVSALLLSAQFLKAEETKNQRGGCHCWNFLGIVEHCNTACDLDESPTTNSGWNWWP